MSTTVPGHSTGRLSFLERTFHVQERGSTLRTEILAGATTSRAFARTTCRLCEHDLCGPQVCPIGCRAAEIEKQENER